MAPRRRKTHTLGASGVALWLATHALLAPAPAAGDVPPSRTAALRTRARTTLRRGAAWVRRAPGATAAGVARRLPGAGHNEPATADVPRIGAHYERDGDTDVTHFRVWAQDHTDVALEVHHPDGTVEHTPMHAEPGGFFSVTRRGVGPGTRYKYRLGSAGALPDPASRSQPDGVNEASEVVDTHFAWTDHAWRGVDLHALNRGGIYEMHVGTFTREGSFDAAAERLDHLQQLGVSAVELMPLASAPGGRGWGYDGVNQFAPLAAYGSPASVRRFINAAHARGIAVLIDVVYNHQGPQGDYTGEFAGAYRNPDVNTPWGPAINYDAPAVRQNVLANARMWVGDFHADGLRLDAAHEIHDAHGSPHILTEIAREARAAAGGRSVVVTAEDERNSNRVVTRESRGGTGIDAVWVDDFHHEVRVALGQERRSYYAGFTGQARDLAKTLNRGWFYRGQRVPGTDRRRGTSSAGVDRAAMIYTIGNHDQYGNRAMGDRLRSNVSAAEFRAARGVLYASPGTPLLMAGDEWGTQTPFRFFTDHAPEFGALVTAGRTHEFRDFGFEAEDVPDPQARATFESSKLNWDELGVPEHAAMLGAAREDVALHARLVSTARYVRARAIGPHAVEQTWRGADGAQIRVLVNLRDGEDVRVPVADAGAQRVTLARDGASLGADGVATLHGAGMLVLESGGAR